MTLKVFSKLGLAESFLNLREDIYQNLQQILCLTRKSEKISLCEWEGKKSSSLLFTIILEALERAGSLEIEMHRSRK